MLRQTELAKACWLDVGRPRPSGRLLVPNARENDERIQNPRSGRAIGLFVQAFAWAIENTN